MDTTALGIHSSLALKQRSSQPHLTCLFPLRFLRVAVASPFTERVQNAQSTTKRLFFPPLLPSPPLERKSP